MNATLCFTEIIELTIHGGYPFGEEGDRLALLLQGWVNRT